MAQSCDKTEQRTALVEQPSDQAHAKTITSVNLSFNFKSFSLLQTLLKTTLVTALVLHPITSSSAIAERPCHVNLRQKGASPTDHCWCQQTRVIALSCGIKTSAVRCSVLSQNLCERQTNKQTEAWTDGQTNKESKEA